MSESIVMPIVVLIGIVAIATTVLTRFRWGSFALAFGLSYALFMILWWLFERNDHVDEANIWSLIIPLMMAAPSSFLLPLAGGPTFAEKCVGLAILGGVQYGFVGFLIDLAIARWKRKRNCQPTSAGDVATRATLEK